MTGLILKDLFVIKKTLVYLVVVMLLFGGIYSSVDNSYFMSFFLSIMTISVVISTMSYDEFYHWDRYAATLPLSRRQIVGAKYLSALIFFAGGTVLALAVGLTIPTLHGSFLTLDEVAVILTAPLVGMLGTAVVLPCYYRFGAQQSRLVMLVLYGVPSLVLVAVLRFSPQLLDGVKEAEISGAAVLGICAAVTAAALGLSYLLSVRIMERKELQ